MRVVRLVAVPALACAMLFGSGLAVAADYDKGLRAYQSGGYTTALAEFLPLAEQGDAASQFYLGRMYANGEGVLENDKTALLWYLLAADQGDSYSQYNLGTMYESGNGVLKNYYTAVKWYTLAAEQGFAHAQYNLGTMYSNGSGVPENDKTAVKWYTLAAEQGFAYAQYNMGTKSLRGEGTPKSDKTAVKWFTMAAEQGHESAQYNLGLMYARGMGVLKDDLRAYMWWNLSAYKGVKEGADNKQKIAKRMTQSQIDKAQEMSRRCLENSYKECGGQQPVQIQQATNDIESLVLAYIRDEVSQEWVRPEDTRNGMLVELYIELIPTGEIVNIEVSYRNASATDKFVASVVRAVTKARQFDKLSQLNSVVFEAKFRKLTVKFSPEYLNL